ncbi:MAG TPA: FAD-dependent monooxygenase [Accumulibacter sp.]|uniref:FAD-dependent monooxygenase n=1 Tax=Accumulibacter sp. TaxID=2053492 RepID=UPI0025CCA57A|nr:FAD-dependent monooxygenase [Accumulibacter sp.]MCM8600516.1 FAD-dependent monooxygenase [Accumulibacter sp.]MCM8663764.1 FAD-dependent monooxygenase [Accumulibacter sp.]HNC51642.1 FAD-dependent monooxygenase [Accumulibacter sp.]
MTEEVESVDVAIVGAGPVGMALALALIDSPYRILLIDSRRRGSWAGDPRALALSHGTRQLLAGVGAWNAGDATPIDTIHVSQKGGFGRTLIDAADYDIPSLGYVLRYRDLAGSLDARCETVQRLDQCTIGGIAIGRDTAEISLRSGDTTRRVAARLVVHAEGTPGDDADVRVHDYRQHAVVAEVRPLPAHGRRAWERFTPDGPVALLPLGQDYAVVFTVPSAQAGGLLCLDDDAFLAALRAQFAGRLDFIASGPRSSFPLALRCRRELVAARQVWIGNAAQSLHPVSGQGFNLGLRDAWELAEALRTATGRDPGEASLLSSYARGRQLDRQGSMVFTDGIVRIFSNDLAPLRVARGLSLLALDLLPPLRHFVAKRMIWGARAWP